MSRVLRPWKAAAAMASPALAGCLSFSSTTSADPAAGGALANCAVPQNQCAQQLCAARGVRSFSCNPVTLDYRCECNP